MPCYHPLKAFRAPGGGIAFKSPPGYRDQPVTLACSQCHGCRLERSRQWAVRCMHEAQMHERNCFLTLTYDDEHLPELGSLDVSHWQDFAKRARNKIGKFRFYHCGEYGDRNGRPHYHAAMFGQDFSHDRILHKTTKGGHPLYTSETLAKLWPLGHHYIGTLTFQSAAYVARYIMKKKNGDQALKRYGEKIDEATGEVTPRLKPEYTTMSRRPGIGHTWITKFMADVYPSDQVICNGVPARPPKYYDQQFELLDPVGFRRIKAKRLAEGETHAANNTYDRLAVREEVSKSKMRHHKREM